ncbi:MAG: hypothetical protein AB4080_08525 [Trichodesmium sp.]
MTTQKSISLLQDGGNMLQVTKCSKLYQSKLLTSVRVIHVWGAFRRKLPLLTSDFPVAVLGYP